MTKTTFIYSLNCPLTGAPRYVGKTNTPRKRYFRHLNELSEDTHKTRWIKTLLGEGLSPDFLVLREVPTGSWEEHERELIALFRSQGFDLTNGSDGGDGGTMLSGKDHYMWGRTRSPEVREKIGAAQRGRKKSAEQVRKTAEANRGKKRTEEQRKRLSIAQRAGWAAKKG